MDPLIPQIKLRDGFRVPLSELRLDDLLADRSLLQRRGLYERALLITYLRVFADHSEWSLQALQELFQSADRRRLLAAGDPLPGHGPFTVYRGVAGNDSGRWMRGLSWTGSIEIARQFSKRLNFPDPGVYQITVDKSDVLAYVNSRQEQEFIVLLPVSAEPQRME